MADDEPVKRAYPEDDHESDADQDRKVRMADQPDDQGPVVIACNLFGLGVSQEVCWVVWIVVYALLIAFLMWMRKRDGGGRGVP